MGYNVKTEKAAEAREHFRTFEDLADAIAALAEAVGVPPPI
jgi:hypothetical protein